MKNYFNSFESEEYLRNPEKQKELRECAYLGLNPKTRKTKQSHSYSYDPFIIWGSPSHEVNFSSYSDKLQSFNPKKCEDLLKKHKLDKGSWLEIEKTEAFLKDYNEVNNVKLLAIVEFCDKSGYPRYRLDYKIS